MKIKPSVEVKSCVHGFQPEIESNPWNTVILCRTKECNCGSAIAPGIIEDGKFGSAVVTVVQHWNERVEKIKNSKCRHGHLLDVFVTPTVQGNAAAKAVDTCECAAHVNSRFNGFSSVCKIDRTSVAGYQKAASEAYENTLNTWKEINLRTAAFKPCVHNNHPTVMVNLADGEAELYTRDCDCGLLVRAIKSDCMDQAEVYSRLADNWNQSQNRLPVNKCVHGYGLQYELRKEGGVKSLMCTTPCSCGDEMRKKTYGDIMSDVKKHASHGLDISNAYREAYISAHAKIAEEWIKVNSPAKETTQEQDKEDFLSSMLQAWRESAEKQDDEELRCVHGTVPTFERVYHGNVPLFRIVTEGCNCATGIGPRFSISSLKDIFFDRNRENASAVNQDDICECAKCRTRRHIHEHMMRERMVAAMTDTQQHDAASEQPRSYSRSAETSKDVQANPNHERDFAKDYFALHKAAIAASHKAVEDINRRFEAARDVVKSKRYENIEDVIVSFDLGK